MGLATNAARIYTVSHGLFYVVACSARSSVPPAMAVVHLVGLAVRVGFLHRLGNSRPSTLAKGLSMKSGMLWLDDDPRSTLEEKVRRAARHYHRKYKRKPDTCLVHRAVFTGETRKTLQVEDVTVRPHHPILPGTFWVGSENFETRAVSR